MKVSADLNKCQGHGLCAMTAPEVFGSRDDGLVVVLREDVPDELAESALDAIEGCPEQALRVVE